MSLLLRLASPGNWVTAGIIEAVTATEVSDSGLIAAVGVLEATTISELEDSATTFVSEATEANSIISVQDVTNTTTSAVVEVNTASSVQDVTNTTTGAAVEANKHNLLKNSLFLGTVGSAPTNWANGTSGTRAILPSETVGGFVCQPCSVTVTVNGSGATVRGDTTNQASYSGTYPASVYVRRPSGASSGGDICFVDAATQIGTICTAATYNAQTADVWVRYTLNVIGTGGVGIGLNIKGSGSVIGNTAQFALPQVQAIGQVQLPTQPTDDVSPYYPVATAQGANTMPATQAALAKNNQLVNSIFNGTVGAAPTLYTVGAGTAVCLQWEVVAGVTCQPIRLSVTANGAAARCYSATNSPAPGSYVVSAYIRRPTGAAITATNGVSFGGLSGSMGILVNAATYNAQTADVWVRYSVTATINLTTVGVLINSGGSLAGDSCDVALIQCEPLGAALSNYQPTDDVSPYYPVASAQANYIASESEVATAAETQSAVLAPAAVAIVEANTLIETESTTVSTTGTVAENNRRNQLVNSIFNGTVGAAPTLYTVGAGTAVCLQWEVVAGVTCQPIRLSVTANGAAARCYSATNSPAPGSYVVSAYIRRPTGAAITATNGVSFGGLSGSMGILVNAATYNAQTADVWVRYSVTATINLTTVGVLINSGGSLAGDSCDVALIQCEPLGAALSNYQPTDDVSPYYPVASAQANYIASESEVATAAETQSVTGLFAVNTSDSSNLLDTSSVSAQFYVNTTDIEFLTENSLAGITLTSAVTETSTLIATALLYFVAAERLLNINAENRILITLVESRVISINTETRLLSVYTENRLISILEENRTLLVNQENRELIS